jgi:hypothetical protein
MTAREAEKPQADKFKDLAREVEADEDEEAFDRALRRMREKKEKPDEDTNT